jgi:hypothetical protein
MLQLFSRLGSWNARDELKPGDRYWRTLGNRFLETATVVELKPDLAGIPHVRFTVAFEHPDAVRVDEGPRILSVARFVDEYRKQDLLADERQPAMD